MLLVAALFVPTAFASAADSFAKASPLLQLRSDQSRATLAQGPTTGTKAQQVVPTSASYEPWSGCFGSACAGSGCVGSLCVGTWCEYSVCILSLGCGNTVCAMSCAGVSGCDSYCEPSTTCEFSSSCFGSNCSSSGCVNSTYCSDSICVSPNYCSIARSVNNGVTFR